MTIRPIISIPLMILITVFLVLSIRRFSKGKLLIVRYMIVTMLFIVDLRISIPNNEIKVERNNTDVVFVVDTTISMDAMDYNGNKTRLSAVKKDIANIIDKMPGVYFSLLSYDHNTTLKIPFTTDGDTVKAAVNSLKVPNTLYARGTNITLFKEELKRILENSSKKDGHIRIVFIFSDGENTSNESISSLSNIKSLVDGGAVLGYGTVKGGKMLARDISGTETILQDKTSYPYKDAISYIDEENLKKMANDIGISYINMNNNADINSLISKIDTKNISSSAEVSYTYKDTYYYYSPILIILFLIELYYDRRRFI